MDWYDLGLRVQDSQTLFTARALGYRGVGILTPYKKGTPKGSNNGPEGLEIVQGVELSRKVKPKAKDIRRSILLISAQGEDRDAVETPEIDVVFPRELNHIMAKLAKKNQVAIGFDFHPLLHESKRGREEVLERYFGIAKLVRKYTVPFLLTSGAKNSWDLRAPSDLIAFGKVLGFSEPACKQALSGNFLKENKKRLGKNWIAPGIEKE